MEEIFKYFPRNIFNLIQKYIIENPKEEILKNATEIRLRVNKPLILRMFDKDLILEYNINQNEILLILEKICENSIYAYKNQLVQGYITIHGGHRVGITGTCVIENDKIINIKYISGLNFRIARQIKGCAKKILNDVLDLENDSIYNTLIVSPPGMGKTTILRDLIRIISNGISELKFHGKNCSLIDERGEIAAMYKGIPQNDIGIRTDVIENVSKSQGIHMLIRAMGPQIVACDEIGTKEDIEAIKYAFCSGVKGIFTMHGLNIEDIRKNINVKELIDDKLIEKIIFLNGKKEEV